MRCELCGHEFDPENLACHAACPLGSRCSLICCPNCGYQVVDEAKTVVSRFLQRFRPNRRPAASSARVPIAVPAGSEGSGVPLTHVAVGSPVRVTSLAEMPSSRVSRLIAFGIAPGSTVRVLQRRPVPVVEIGQTELALSEEILAQIQVEPPRN